MLYSLLIFFLSNVIGLFKTFSSLEPTGGADNSLAQPTSRCILFDGENISFDANLVLYICI